MKSWPLRLALAGSLWLSASAQTWQPVGTVPGTFGSIDFLTADHHGNLWCGYHGVYRSTDHGATWQYVKVDSTTPAIWPGFVPLVFDLAAATNGRMLLGSEGPYPSLVASDDDGASWRYCTPPVGPGTSFDIPMSMAIGPNGDFYALCSLNPDGATGIYHSTNGGLSWTRTPLEAAKTLSLDDISVGPTGVVYAIEGMHTNPGPWHLYKSVDAGASWTSTEIALQPFS